MALRWGFLGTGYVAEQMAEAIRYIGSEVTAVASRHLEKAERFAGQVGAAAFTDDYEALCRRADVDVVYIDLPHTLHCAMSLYALRQGKHVLCEKPVALNAAEAQAMFRCAREQGRFFMEATWTRFLPLLQRLMALAQSGELGKPRLFKADFSIDAGVRCPGHRLVDPLVGGGALLDTGVYPLTVAAMLFGGKAEVLWSEARLAGGVDMENCTVLGYQDGARAILYSGVSGTLPQDGLIVCERGYILLHGFFHCTSAEVCKDGVVECLEHPFDCNGYEYQLRHLEQCVSEGLCESPILSHMHSLEIMELTDALRRRWGLVYPGEEESKAMLLSDSQSI